MTETVMERRAKKGKITWGSAQSSILEANRLVSLHQDQERAFGKDSNNFGSPLRAEEPMENTLVIGPTGSGKTVVNK